MGGSLFDEIPFFFIPYTPSLCEAIYFSYCSCLGATGGHAVTAGAPRRRGDKYTLAAYEVPGGEILSLYCLLHTCDCF